MTLNKCHEKSVNLAMVMTFIAGKHHMSRPHDMASSWAAAYLPVTQWNSCLSMSRRRPEAPILNMLLLSQESPSSSLIKINQFIASLAVLIPPAGLKPTLKPVTSWYSLMARHMTSPTARVALTPSFPVLVLMKSEPAIMQTREHLYTLFIDPSSPMARIDFMWA